MRAKDEQREALLHKLQQLNINGLFYQQIKSMLKDVMVRVKVNNQVSDYFRSEIGLKQGEVLSPILFNMYLHDINECFNQDCDPVVLNNRCLSSLQYADDLIVISQTSEGLQKSMDNLNTYCKKWKLSININKTKYMAIEKKKSKNPTKINLGDTPLERVDNYTYLGIDITSNGTFTTCKDTLTNKARKAMYKLKGLINGTNIKKSLALKLFDQLITTIATYGSVIWGPLDLSKILKEGTLTKLEDLYNKLPQEKLNSHFCKYLLGISNKATNLAALSELGRCPLYTSIIPQVLKYYVRLKNMQEDTLLKQALYEMEKQKSSNKTSWLSIVEHIKNLLSPQSRQIIDGENALNKRHSKLINNDIYQRFITHWSLTMQAQNGKLDTYKIIKTEFKYEPYLDYVKSKEKLTALTRIRTSCHKLNIEAGRYKRPIIPREERLCDMCKNGVEDEYHFIFICPKYNLIRQSTIGEFNTNLSREILLKKYLGDFEERNPEQIATYVEVAMTLRNNSSVEL